MKSPAGNIDNLKTASPVLEPSTKTDSFSLWNLGVKRSPSRSIPIDFLRGVAVLLILLYHGIHIPGDHNFWQYATTISTQIGWLGVDLFFVLSGFLIGGLLFKEIRKSGSLDAKRFLIRRGLKIWPAYFCLLVLGCIFYKLDPFGVNHGLSSVKWNLIHLQNYYYGPFNITWTLAVEEHFYLGLPLLLLLILNFEKAPRDRLVFFPIASVMVLVLCLSFRFINPPSETYDPFTRLFPTHIRMDSLMWGVFLAYIFHFIPLKFESLVKRSWLMALIAVVLLSPTTFISIRDPLMYTWGYTIIYLGFGALLLTCLGSQSQKSTKRERFWNLGVCRLVASIGFYSYGIYLWHYDFVKGFWDWFLNLPTTPHLPSVLSYPILTTIYFATSIAVGIGMTKLIEIPFLIWRDKLFPAKDGRQI